MQDDVCCQTGGEEVTSEDEVNVQLESSVVEDDVDAALSLALGLGLLQQLVHSGEVVGDDVLLRSLAGLGALQLLDVLVRQARQQGQVSRVAPQANLAHLSEEKLLGGLVVGGALVATDLLDNILVLGGKLDDCGARRAEGADLLAGEDIVALPVSGLGKVGADASVFCTLSTESEVVGHYFANGELT